jgi:hypothetical protein
VVHFSPFRGEVLGGGRHFPYGLPMPLGTDGLLAILEPSVRGSMPASINLAISESNIHSGSSMRAW